MRYREGPEGSRGVSVAAHGAVVGIAPSLEAPWILASLLCCVPLRTHSPPLLGKMKGISSPCTTRLCLIAGSVRMCARARVHPYACVQREGLTFSRWLG